MRPTWHDFLRATACLVGAAAFALLDAGAGKWVAVAAWVALAVLFLADRKAKRKLLLVAVVLVWTAVWLLRS